MTESIEHARRNNNEENTIWKIKLKKYFDSAWSQTKQLLWNSVLFLFTFVACKYVENVFLVLYLCWRTMINYYYNWAHNTIQFIIFLRISRKSKWIQYSLSLHSEIPTNKSITIYINLLELEQNMQFIIGYIR